ncbi:DUF1800 domain-containing protein [Hymenobacter busanensis]|uniref:DUF1800 domain-containing protein n=1 Tax=Hymenobacter busanensis TaxID=2607656 RepID=A0A7L5A1A3_9BACT|nr:DUF1800 domain-containing protein [Hymenobacter busanensis]KAA9331624.1 DUF1800 domain-containing protein [Hymenobacter busanensis]QHJ08775.1 DUF1800 family protein [Hymenobacter busanensis]
MTTHQQLQHLYWRAGFGPRPQDVESGLSVRKALKQLLQDAKTVAPLGGAQMQYAEQMALAPVPTTDLRQDPQAPALKRGQLTPEQRKEQNRQIRDAFYAMNTGWLERMATSPAQIREKLTFFWHGHFAARVRRPDAALQLNNTVRRLALGKFSDLLLAVSKEPAMLQFLNNQQNRKQHPNENFAREVMELFTIGRGYYTEQDVKEAARAFTGWSYDAQGQFVFRPRQHDDGPKTFMGRTGNFGGEDILRMLLERRETATFLTTKLYRFFVNDTPNPQHIEPLADAFFKSGYDIEDLMERLLSAEWFYSPANVGTRIKSPVELLVGLRRQTGLQPADGKLLVFWQKALGQTLFQPPNVAGWPGGRNWIDSSSLLLRLQLPQVLLKQAEVNVALKEDENDLAPSVPRLERLLRTRDKQPNDAPVSLTRVAELLRNVPAEKQVPVLAGFLLQTPLRPENLTLVQHPAGSAAEAQRLRTQLGALLSLPEYQLC